MSCFFHSSHQSFANEGSPLYETFDFNIDFEAADHLYKTGCEKFVNSFKNQTQSTDLLSLELHVKDYFKLENLSLSPLLSTCDSYHHSEDNLSPQTPKIPTKVPKKKNLKRRSTEDSDFNFSIEANSPSHSHQNEMKNHQGTFAGKIKKLCQRNNETGEDTRLFRTATFALSEVKREEFRRWVTTYKKTDKTWKKLKEFMSSNSEFGVIFSDMIIFLFTEEFKNEYEECIREGSMSEKNKILLREQSSKDFFIFKFTLIRDELLGFAIDFEQNVKMSREKPKKIKTQTL